MMSALQISGNFDLPTQSLLRKYLNDNWEQASFRKKHLSGTVFNAAHLKGLQTFLNAQKQGPDLLVDGIESSEMVIKLRKFLNRNWSTAGFRQKKLSLSKIKPELDSNTGTMKALQWFLNNHNGLANVKPPKAELKVGKNSKIKVIKSKVGKKSKIGSLLAKMGGNIPMIKPCSDIHVRENATVSTTISAEKAENMVKSTMISRPAQANNRRRAKKKKKRFNFESSTIAPRPAHLKKVETDDSHNDKIVVNCQGGHEGKVGANNKSNNNSMDNNDNTFNGNGNNNHDKTINQSENDKCDTYGTGILKDATGAAPDQQKANYERAEDSERSKKVITDNTTNNNGKSGKDTRGKRDSGNFKNTGTTSDKQNRKAGHARKSRGKIGALLAKMGNIKLATPGMLSPYSPKSGNSSPRTPHSDASQVLEATKVVVTSRPMQRKKKKQRRLPARRRMQFDFGSKFLPPPKSACKVQDLIEQDANETSASKVANTVPDVVCHGEGGKEICETKETPAVVGEIQQKPIVIEQEAGTSGAQAEYTKVEKISDDDVHVKAVTNGAIPILCNVEDGPNSEKQKKSLSRLDDDDALGTFPQTCVESKADGKECFVATKKLLAPNISSTDKFKEGNDDNRKDVADEECPVGRICHQQSLGIEHKPSVDQIEENGFVNLDGLQDGEGDNENSLPKQHSSVKAAEEATAATKKLLAPNISSTDELKKEGNDGDGEDVVEQVTLEERPEGRIGRRQSLGIEYKPNADQIGDNGFVDLDGLQDVEDNNKISMTKQQFSAKGAGGVIDGQLAKVDFEETKAILAEGVVALRNHLSHFEDTVDVCRLLLYAVQTDNNDCARLLIDDYQANVNTISIENKYSPLHWAVLNGNKELIKALILHGADKSQQNSDKETPIQTCVSEIGKYRVKDEKYSQYKECHQLLVPEEYTFVKSKLNAIDEVAQQHNSFDDQMSFQYLQDFVRHSKRHIHTNDEMKQNLDKRIELWTGQSASNPSVQPILDTLQWLQQKLAM